MSGLHKDANKVHRRKEDVQSISFFVNDIDPVLIARNTLILEIIDSIDVNNRNDVAFLWAVWYNKDISKEHHQRLIIMIECLLDGRKLGSLWELYDKESKQVVRNVWNYWTTEKFDRKKIMSERKEYLNYSKRARAIASTSSGFGHNTDSQDDDFSGFAITSVLRFIYAIISVGLIYSVF